MGDLIRLKDRLFGHTFEERFPMEDAARMRLLPKRVHSLLLPALRAHKPIIFLCIGTDRSTGDALGPLVGNKLSEWRERPFEVFGTLDDPVHASNLKQAIHTIESHFPERFVVAVDACLGRLENVGSITLGSGSLRPGAGVNKNLPPVGDCFITGTVNVGGFMEYFVLQNTRLSFVMRMAEAISQAVRQAFELYDRSFSAEADDSLREAAKVTDPAGFI